MKRRRVRRYRGAKKNSGVKFFGFIGIIIGAVICGYLTARFVAAPLLGYDTEVLKLDFPSKISTFLDEQAEKRDAAGESTDDDSDVSNDQDAKDGMDDDNERENDDEDSTDEADDRNEQNDADDDSDNVEKGYTLQFGVFSAESGAEELEDELEKLGIDADIRKDGGNYKVIGEIYKNKDDAVKALEKLQKLKDKKKIDVFIKPV